ncbi:hypothetical protein [Chryseobacterium carnipullorum]|uniref:hypothetical protein n=1 Tax=Chryseobacterium carnipullorum TaxID=1124835 RepID=UPI0023F2E23A|nr:hypothetical protein [Chryseobacterium carnipullorum]
MNIPGSFREILISMALLIFLFGNAREKNDSRHHKNRQKKTESIKIFIYEETSVYARKLIYNATFPVIIKKIIKSNSKFSAQKKTIATKTKEKTQTKNINYYDHIITTHGSDKKIRVSAHEKYHYISLPKHHSPYFTIRKTVVSQLYFLVKLLPSIYNHILIENGKNKAFSIRPPPKKKFNI